jgi:hypothetical protein
MSTFERMLQVLEQAVSRPIAPRMARPRVRAGRKTQLQAESLESRKLLAIDVIEGGPVSDYLIVVSSPDAPGQAADDVFITRDAAGQLLVASDSSFTPEVLPGRYDTPDTVFVTNGRRVAAPSPLTLGNNRSTDNNGPGYGQDAQLSTRTTFVLSNGSINSPVYQLDFGSRIGDTSQPRYDGATTQFDYLINARVKGEVSYDGATWEFQVAPGGEVFFRLMSGSPGSARPLRGALQAGDQGVFDDGVVGRGSHGSFEITWSQPVATAGLPSAGVPAPPVLNAIRYTADRTTANSSDLLRFGGGIDFFVTDSDIYPSAPSNPAYQFDVGGDRRIIEGTLAGTVVVRGHALGDTGLPGTIRFPFTTDLAASAGRTLYFVTPADSWLKVRGTYDATGQIQLEFAQRYTGSGFLDNGWFSARPGSVTIEGLSLFEYVTPVLPNDFTLFAGFDLPSQLKVDLLAPGSTINIDSPIAVRSGIPVVANLADVDLRATNVNINARTASTDDLFIGASSSGATAESVILNANVSVPNEARIFVEDDPRTTVANGLGRDRGRFVVSQTGSLAASFFLTAPPFGDSAVRPVTNDIEPNDDGVPGGSAADLPRAQDLSGSFRSIGDNFYQATVNGTIATGNDGDLDFYRVPIRDGDVVEVSLVGLTLSDPFVRVFNGAGEQVRADDDSGVGLNSFLRYEYTGADGYIYIAADSFGSSRGTYQLTITVQGIRALPTRTLLVTSVVSDIFIEGGVYAVDQSYLMRSTAASMSKAPFTMTTSSAGTGAEVGVIRGGTLQVVLANDADNPLDNAITYNVVDLRTAVDSLRVRTSVRQNGVDTSPNGPFPYRLTLREENAITIDAVAATSLPVDVAADGSITWTAALHTTGDVVVATRYLADVYSPFVATAPIQSAVGTIRVAASDIVIGGGMSASTAPRAPINPLRTDISLFADNGSVQMAGLVESPNRISIVQSTPDGKGGRVSGVGRVRTGELVVNAVTIGNPEADPASDAFYLRTAVDSIVADVRSGAAIDEEDDVAVARLYSPEGLVALRAGGADGRPGSTNDLALTANLIAVTNLFVTAPNGSIDVRNDTANRMLMGIPRYIQASTSESMRAAGSVTIISAAGGIDVLDAPLAGSGARQVVASSTAALPAVYDRGVPGRFASSITATANGSLNDQRSPGRAFANVASVFRAGDRVLVRAGVAGAGAPANGLYVITDLGSATTPWKLTRAGDSDTLAELPTNTIVYDIDRATYWRLSHEMDQVADFGAEGILVEGQEVGFEPTTTICTGLVVPQNDINLVVSTSAGRNDAAGALGKMIALRQDNQPLDPEQAYNFSFSSQIREPIALQQELPPITKVFAISGSQRFTPTGLSLVGQPIVVNGQLITTASTGANLFRATVNATVTQNKPTVLLLPATFASAAELRVGMSAAGIGVRPGSVVVNIVRTAGGSTEVTLDVPVTAIFNRFTRRASVAVTFSTEIVGFHYVGEASGAQLSDLHAGGFESGAAVKSEVSELQLRNVVLGAAPDGRRLGNQIGVAISGAGNAAIAGGGLYGSTVAAVRTSGKDSSVSVVGTTVGSVSLPNVVGLEILGSGSALIGAAGAAETVVQYNRTGALFRDGRNAVINTTISDNSFDGIALEGGVNTIGYGSKLPLGVDSNIIVRNGRWGINMASVGMAWRSQKVFGNYFSLQGRSSLPSGGSNVKGSVTLDGLKAAAAPYAPNATSGVDANGNQHWTGGTAAAPGGGRGPVVRPVTPIRFPWRPR